MKTKFHIFLPILVLLLGATASEAIAREVTTDAVSLVTRPAGVIASNLAKDDFCSTAAEMLGVAPADDEGALWVDSADGTLIVYQGMSPEMSMCVHYGAEHMKDFSYFFIFPYTEASHADINLEQARFCGALLQELHDRGYPLCADGNTDALFDVDGRTAETDFNMRLVDNADDMRYLLIISVYPENFTAQE